MSSDPLNLLIPPEDRLVESVGGPGLYYLVPVPPAGHPRWELIAFSYDEYGDDSGHTELWQEYLPAALAMRWARRERARQLEAALLGLDHAFPREGGACSFLPILVNLSTVLSQRLPQPHVFGHETVERGRAV